MVPPAGFKPATLTLEVSRSIQLSYEGVSWHTLPYLPFRVKGLKTAQLVFKNPIGFHLGKFNDIIIKRTGKIAPPKRYDEL